MNTTIARFLAFVFASLLLGLAALLLGVSDQGTAAAVFAVLALAVFAVGFVMGLVSVPHDRIRSHREYTLIGTVAVVTAVPTFALAAIRLAMVDYPLGPLGGALQVVIGVCTAILGISTLSERRLLRRVPDLLAPGEEPRALAFGANAMPGWPQLLVVATNERIVWAAGRGLRERHSIRLADVTAVDVDRSRAILTVEGGGERLRVGPVPTRELAKFDALLRGSHVAAQ